MTTPAIKPGAALAAAKRAARRERDWDWYLSLYGHGDCFVGFLRILPELDREERASTGACCATGGRASQRRGATWRPGADCSRPSAPTAGR
jgi:hypothetical protein